MEEFESFVWKDYNNNNNNGGVNYEYGNGGSYSRKLIEFCSAKALKEFYQNIEEKISYGLFSRFTFDLMLAWEMPTSADEDCRTVKV